LRRSISTPNSRKGEAAKKSASVRSRLARCAHSSAETMTAVVFPLQRNGLRPVRQRAIQHLAELRLRLRDRPNIAHGRLHFATTIVMIVIYEIDSKSTPWRQSALKRWFGYDQ
jgi:hypothetical protein